MSKSIRFVLCLMALWAGRTRVDAATAGYTLLVAPARYSVMQVAFDIVQRNPAVLVSYQVSSADAEPLLHAWNGQEWIHISMQDFREVSFLDKMPARTVLIGDDKTMPMQLADAASWSPEIIRVNSLSTSPLVNEMGRVFHWSSPEWKWFASRYNLDLHDESEAQRKSSWYDQPGPLYRPPLGDVMKMSDNRSAYSESPAPVTETEYTAPVFTDTALPEEPATPAVEEKPASWSAPETVGEDTGTGY